MRDMLLKVIGLWGGLGGLLLGIGLWMLLLRGIDWVGGPQARTYSSEQAMEPNIDDNHGRR